MEEFKAQMFKFGPLHEDRHLIDQILRSIPIQTGDIFYRASDAKGPFGIPFSQLVAKVTKSEYSHAAMAIVENGDPYILEINDQGTLKYRLIDWLDTCYTDKFSVYRLKEIDDDLRQQIEAEILKILADDPDYDLTFSDPDKFYCTESVATVYHRVGISLIEPEIIKDVTSKPVYWILRAGSWICSLFSNTALDFEQKMYYVGNDEKGMMSSDKTYCEYYHFKL